MRFLRLIALLATVVAAATSISSAGAGNGNAKKADLSTDQAVAAYLTSIGVDPASVVIQRGAKNYAGPFCPGAGWNCTTAAAVVQVATTGGENRFQCGDPALFGTAAVPAAGYRTGGRCLAIQDTAGGTNTIDIRKSSPNGTSLSCPENGRQQTSAGGQNHFNCHLVIHVTGSELEQTARETAGTTQIAAGGGNHANIYLEISLTSTVKSPTGAQKQNAWQSVTLEQIATEGAENHSVVDEKQFLRARISGATTSHQFQNTEELPVDFNDCVEPSIVDAPNSCANINQMADGGHQQSELNLVNDLDARTSAVAGSQTQGCEPVTNPDCTVTTGLDGTVPQPTTGSTDTSHEDYDERQDVVAGSDAVEQNQTAPQACCALQTGSAPNSLVNADQESTQNASTSTAPLDPLALLIPNPNAMQVTVLFGKIETDGDGTLTHRYRQDGGSDTRQCTPEALEDETPACAFLTVAVNGEPVTCEPGEVIVPDEDGGFTCESPAPPVICPEGTNLEDGRCEPVCPSGTHREPIPAPAPPPAPSYSCEPNPIT